MCRVPQRGLRSEDAFMGGMTPQAGRTRVGGPLPEPRSRSGAPRTTGDGVSGYQAVARQLRTWIAAGQVVAGQRLPAETEIAARFGVARDTVRRALAMLADEGMVRIVHGRGTFVVSAGASLPGEPKYAVVTAAVAGQIAKGKLPVGAVVPSEAEVQAEFGVSRTTARRAFAELEAR